MSKSQTVFVCSNCDSQFPKWAGRCLSCGKWNTLAEQSFGPAVTAAISAKPGKPISLSEVDSRQLKRLDTGSGEVNQILGESGGQSGLVPGSLVLLGGDPGIGKSTLALQIAIHLATAGTKTLYVSGEESLSQVKLRAERINKDLSHLQVMSENNLETILATIQANHPEFLVIDSIQTMYTETVSGVAGGVAQVASATTKIMELAKNLSVATIIIGHVTKEGNLAGPRMLEHMVDVVLYLEGERFLSFRVLRCIKNRFGATSEVGVFEMQPQGLATVENPSAVFLAQRVVRTPGNAVSCTVEGSRALLLELQALTSRSQFSYPKRTANGFDNNRLQLLAAVLQKRLHLNLFEQDIFVSVAGGLKISETACDLAMALSIVSSIKDAALPDDLVIIGEVGLSGEVRAIGQAEKRVKEAAKLGFKAIMLPAGNRISGDKIKVVQVADIAEAQAKLWKK